jgi:hypothetical protein
VAQFAADQKAVIPDSFGDAAWPMSGNGRIGISRSPAGDRAHVVVAVPRWAIPPRRFRTRGRGRCPRTGSHPSLGGSGRPNQQWRASYRLTAPSLARFRLVVADRRPLSPVSLPGEQKHRGQEHRILGDDPEHGMGESRAKPLPRSTHRRSKLQGGSSICWSVRHFQGRQSPAAAPLPEVA